MDAERLDNGHILAPVRLQTDEMIGDGVVDLAPGDPDYDEWDEYLGGGSKETKALHLRQWEAKALRDFERKGRVYRVFESDVIDADERARIEAALAQADSIAAIKAAFKHERVHTALVSAGLSLPRSVAVSGQLTTDERDEVAQRIGNIGLSDAVIEERGYTKALKRDSVDTLLDDVDADARAWVEEATQ